VAGGAGVAADSFFSFSSFLRFFDLPLVACLDSGFYKLAGLTGDYFSTLGSSFLRAF